MFSEAISDLQPHHSRRRFLLTASSYLFAAFHSQLAFGSDDKDAVNIGQAPSAARVKHAVLLAAGYMQRACGADGRFVYLVNIRTGEQSTSYNAVRHAGAIHALAMLQRQYPSTETKEAMLRATMYLRRLYLGPTTVPDVLVIWSKPAPDHRLTVLGASGLGLLAFAEVRQQSPESIPLVELQALGRFILLQQREDGSFASKYSIAEGPEDSFESFYYPGEAVLGLLALHELDRSPAWLTGAIKGLMYLAQSRHDLSRLPADHWTLIATAKLILICEKAAIDFPREKLRHHAEQLCNSILNESVVLNTTLDLGKNTKIISHTTPIATRTEGLLEALTFISTESLRSRVSTLVNEYIALLLRSQIQFGIYAGGMPGAVASLSPTAEYIRIDYVQHALSAWLYANAGLQRD